MISVLVVQEEDAKALQHYGVGSCGPRGFYGTIDAHTHLEHALAAFMGAEQAIVYSFDIATMPSVLPAFATRKDVIVLDEAASWPLRNGASLSRAQGAYMPRWWRGAGAPPPCMCSVLYCTARVCLAVFDVWLRGVTVEIHGI